VAAASLPAFLLGTWAATWLLPRSLVRNTFLEWEVGAAVALLVGMSVAAMVDPSWKVARNGTFVALGTAAVGMAVVVLSSPRPFWQRYELWATWIGRVALLVVLAGLAWERRRSRPMITWLLAGLALLPVTLHTSLTVDRALRGTAIRSWNVFHYYVGSKYFSELGYFDLYAATLYADDRWQETKQDLEPEEAAGLNALPDFRHIELTRDLYKNRRVPRDEATAKFDPGIISEARLAELGEDTRFLRRYLGTERWREVLWDFGYNPAPTWTVLATPLANLIPTDHWSFRFITNSDLPLYLGIIGLIWWAFGLRAAAVGTLWMFAVPFNHLRFAGGFLQYDWLFAAVLTVCAWKKDRFALAGAAMSYAAMTRVFPGFMVIPVLLAMMREVRLGTGPWLRRLSRSHLRFMVALALGSALLFGASHLTGKGLDAWPSWMHKISNHSKFHPFTSDQRIGIGRLAVHAPSEEDFWAKIPGNTTEQFKRSLPRRYLIQLLCLPLLMVALPRRRELDGMILMLFAVFLVVTLSRYYASIWILLPLLGATDRHRWSWPGAWAAVCLLLIPATFFLPAHEMGRYFLANYVALALFAGLCGGLILSDLRKDRREAQT